MLWRSLVWEERQLFIMKRPLVKNTKRRLTGYHFKLGDEFLKIF
jgi:hypothetical protein